MENLLIAANTVLPMFLMIGVGCLVKQTRMLSESAALQANSMCFRLFTPLLLFQSIYNVDLNTAFHGPVLLFCFCGIMAEFLLGLPLVLRIEKQNACRSVMLQGFFRTNVVLFALPMCISLFGAENLGEMTMLVAIVVPLVNILAVVDLELFRGGKPDPVKILRGVATNPLVLGALAGILCLLTKFRLPQAVESAVNSLANIATPLALVLLGVSLDFKKFAASARSLTISVLMRLVILPGIFIALAVLLGFRGRPLGCIMLVFAPPVAVASYPMAAEMGGDADLAAEIVLLTTACSCVTLFFWIWLLKTLCLL